jgi:TerC family integral membrane protein
MLAFAVSPGVAHLRRYTRVGILSSGVSNPTTPKSRRVIVAVKEAPRTEKISINQSVQVTDSVPLDDDLAVLGAEAELRKHDLAMTLAFIGIAGIAAGGFAYFEGFQRALEFVAGYVVEYSLSVDNLFVFLLIFKFFQVPRASQERVLHYGIIGAVVMRGIMIVLGEELTHHFKAVTLGFAAILLFSASKLLLEGESEDEDLNHNQIVKFARSLLPFSDEYDGKNFFTLKDGIKVATPLMLVLLCIEMSDVVFALDSVPAVLGISTDTKVVYLSNILAIMGLRNLYFLLADTIGELRFLRPSLAIVLGFVGAKMICGVAGYEVGIIPSLSFLLITLGGGAGLSIAFPEPKEEVE